MEINSTTGQVRIEKDKLIFPRFVGYETTNSVEELRNKISRYLPRVELSELLIEVNQWTNFL